MAKAVQFRGVTRAFEEHIVIQDVSLDIYENEVLGLIGGNGSGKTTLLELMAGVLRPTLGSIKMQLSGTDVRDVYRNRAEAKKYLGFGLQSPSFYPSMTVQENVAYFSSLHGMEDTSTESYRSELLNRLRLADKTDIVAHRLSGGMKKRLDIACATVHQPRYIFLDEPASDLDPELRSTVWDVITWFAEKGATVVFSTHYLDELQSFTDRVAVLQRGRLVEVKTPDQLHAEVNTNVIIELGLDDADRRAVLNALQEFSVVSEEPVKVEAAHPTHVFQSLSHNELLDCVELVNTKRDGLASLIHE